MPTPVPTPRSPMRTFGLLFAFSLLLSCHGSARGGDSLMVSMQDLCWSYDGNFLYFTAMKVKPRFADYHPGKWSVYKYDVKAKTVNKIVDSAFTVAASPLGYVIAVGKLVNGNRDIYVMNDDGTDARRITTDPGEDLGASFSPDGKRIVFDSRRSGKPGIYVIDTDAGGLKRLTASNGFSSYIPSWSPDGSRIAYYLGKGDHKDQIHIMKPDGTGDENITRDTLNNFFPGWIDAKTLIYGSGGATMPTRTFTIARDGSSKTPLANIHSFYARYSPDRLMIAYIDPKNQCIRITTPKGMEIDRVTLP